MNYINFEQNGGFPLATDILSFMQNNQNFLSEIAEGFGELVNVGDAVAVHGCVDNGTSITPGLIYLKKSDGTKELLPFLKNPVLSSGATYYTITGSTEQREFYDGQCRDVMYSRWCEISKTPTDYLISNIKHPKTLVELTSGLNTTNNTISTLNQTVVNDSVPIGTIVMWSNFGGKKYPENWRPCTGGTYNGIEIPDMRARFPVGVNDVAGEDMPLYQVNNVGGESYHRLTANESGLPNHSHTYTFTRMSEPQTSNKHETDHRAKGYESQSTSETGGWEAQNKHENRPPYYAVIYIIKVY